MTKLEFAELLRLSMGVDAQDKRASFDDRVIWRLGDVVRGELIDAYAQDSESKGEFVRGIVIDVQNDSVRNRRYVEITGNVLNLPNNAGFVSMSLTQGDETPFVISNAGQVGIASGLECENVGNTVGWQEGGRVYFKDLDPIVEKVLVIGIPSIAALDDNEAIPVPFGMESIWFDKTKAKFGPAMQVEDNNSSDTKAPKE